MAKVVEAPIPEKTFYSIREVSRITKIKAYILRYWESEFKLLRPARRESGQRKYTQKDIDQILKIRELLYVKRFTLEGAKRVLLNENRRSPEQMMLGFQESTAASSVLRETKKEVSDLLKILSR